MIIGIEPHILEHQVKQTLENIANKAAGIDETPVKFIKNFQNDAIKVLLVVHKPTIGKDHSNTRIRQC